MLHRMLVGSLALTLLAALFSLPTLNSADAARSKASSRSGCLPGVLRTRLSQIRSRFGPVRVISTFRRGARIAGSGRRSFHASCRAVDFHAPRGKYRAVVAWLKRNHFGGIGTYSCGMHHIHIDNGPRIRFHHCVNRRGRPSRYAKRRRSRKARAVYRRRGRAIAKRRTSRRKYASRRRKTQRKTSKAPIRVARRFTTRGYMRTAMQNGS